MIKSITEESKYWPLDAINAMPEKERPTILYYKGNISLLQNINKNIAVIGSRNIDGSIIKREKSIVNYLTDNNFNIVSGLALGCDTVAHEQTLANSGKTIAILSTKLDYIYPKENKDLAAKIVDNGGLLISEYNDYDSKLFIKRLIDRDRLQAAFSKCVIACAGNAKSGTRHAINKAQLYNKDVLFMYNENVDSENKSFELAKVKLDEGLGKVVTKSTLNELKSNINYVSGDLFDYDVDAIINTINCVGVMGKGLALEFKNRYPKNYAHYKTQCNYNKVKTGKMLTFKENDTWIINFPTKQNWKHKSKMSYIEDGLDDLVNVIIDNNIKSIAIPALGAGLGGLDWNEVKAVINNKLEDISHDVKIYVFEPL